ncbi:hypothetical protein [Burkholderia ubonensis]|uniref:Osmotically-inducible lipoprotein OsmE n=1 Tax=Burkholderia ubonensis TaxID=101571 RepID=A0A119M724_9BURK|nr:hypothetical protein [Burkholderia ubonensis]AOK61861.1 hypothetical protein WM29_22235 [Burkholderia ubonensis]KVS41747.1 hypothetical protein WK38_30715 [Burkholderia ubonensis]KVS44522.1 hypothetical protein WK37_14415 [Burkholderia ubonensis]KVS76695.1 hypothetical protein WK42_02410 [Burkholderia ubonensis]KVS89992.1 hypothetical protein WK44_17850 [Burkholderia ubonensis]
MRSIPMSRPAAALSLAAGCLMISGCAWFEALLPFSYSRLPVPRVASARGATRADVIRAGGNPRSVWMVRNGSGVCYNYRLDHGDQYRSYFVVFDDAGVVTRHGFETCMDADRKGLLQTKKVGAR